MESIRKVLDIIPTNQESGKHEEAEPEEPHESRGILEKLKDWMPSLQAEKPLETCKVERIPRSAGSGSTIVERLQKFVHGGAPEPSIIESKNEPAHGAGEQVPWLEPSFHAETTRHVSRTRPHPSEQQTDKSTKIHEQPPAGSLPDLQELTQQERDVTGHVPRPYPSEEAHHVAQHAEKAVRGHEQPSGGLPDLQELTQQERDVTGHVTRPYPSEEAHHATTQTRISLSPPAPQEEPQVPVPSNTARERSSPGPQADIHDLVDLEPYLVELPRQLSPTNDQAGRRSIRQSETEEGVLTPPPSPATSDWSDLPATGQTLPELIDNEPLRLDATLSPPAAGGPHRPFEPRSPPHPTEGCESSQEGDRPHLPTEESYEPALRQGLEREASQKTVEVVGSMAGPATASSSVGTSRNGTVATSDEAGAAAWVVVHELNPAAPSPSARLTDMSARSPLSPVSFKLPSEATIPPSEVVAVVEEDREAPEYLILINVIMSSTEHLTADDSRVFFDVCTIATDPEYVELVTRGRPMDDPDGSGLRGREFVVRRRFRDFRALYHQLSLLYPHLLMSFPEKAPDTAAELAHHNSTLVAPYNATAETKHQLAVQLFWNAHRRRLGRFLRRLAGHPDSRKSRELLDFLTLSTWEPSGMGSERGWISEKLLNLKIHSNLGAGAPRDHPGDAESWSGVTAYFVGLRDRVHRVVTAIRALERRFKELSMDWVLMGATLSELADIERTGVPPATRAALKDVSRTAAAMSPLCVFETEDDDGMADALEEYEHYVVSLNNIGHHRDLLYASVAEKQVQLHDERGRLNRVMRTGHTGALDTLACLLSTSPKDAEKHHRKQEHKIQEKIVQLMIAETAARHDYELFCERVRCEIDRVLRDKNAEYKRLLSKLVECQISYHLQSSQGWADLASRLNRS